jgi:hypothetical protein
MRYSQQVYSQIPFGLTNAASTSSGIRMGISGCIVEDEFDFPEASALMPVNDLYKRKHIDYKKYSREYSSQIVRFPEDINQSVNLETSLDRIIPDELYEYGTIIPLIPKKKYEIDLEIIDVRKAKHKIVDPDWI